MRAAVNTVPSEGNPSLPSHRALAAHPRAHNCTHKGRSTIDCCAAQDCNRAVTAGIGESAQRPETLSRAWTLHQPNLSEVPSRARQSFCATGKYRATTLQPRRLHDEHTAARIAGNTSCKTEDESRWASSNTSALSERHLLLHANLKRGTRLELDATRVPAPHAWLTCASVAQLCPKPAVGRLQLGHSRWRLEGRAPQLTA